MCTVCTAHVIIRLTAINTNLTCKAHVRVNKSFTLPNFHIGKRKIRFRLVKNQCSLSLTLMMVNCRNRFLLIEKITLFTNFLIFFHGRRTVVGACVPQTGNNFPFSFYFLVCVCLFCLLITCTVL